MPLDIIYVQSFPQDEQIKLVAVFRDQQEHDSVYEKVRFNLGQYLLTTVSPIICILELQ